MNKDYIDSLDEKAIREILRRIISNGGAVNIDKYFKFMNRVPEIKFFLRAFDETPKGGFVATTYVQNSLNRLKTNE